MNSKELSLLVVGAGAVGGMIHEIENKTREITIDNFNDPVFE